MTDYKSSEDPQRAFYLISALNIMREYPMFAALRASFDSELHEMNQRQVERDQKEAEKPRTAPHSPRGADIGAIRRGG
jgi:hypothetical protein